MNGKASAEYLQHVYDSACSEAVTGIAAGLSRDEVIEAIAEHVHLDAVDDIIADAMGDAMKQGVEREDMDDSWFT